MKCFDEKVKILDQSKMLSICMTRHKDLDVSFQINKKRKEAKAKASNPSTPKRAQPTVSSGSKDLPPTPIATKKQKVESSESESDEDLDARLRKYISQGFAN